MASLATIALVGNLGKAPQTNYTPNGKMNVRFSMAVTKRKLDGTEQTNWFSVTAWGKLAEILDTLTQQGALAKGRQVYVAGSFEARDYQANDGGTRTSLDVNATDVLLLGSREHAPENVATMDDVPF